MLSKWSGELLTKIYYDPKHPAAYGGVARLVSATGLRPNVVKDWLRSQRTYTLHKVARKKYGKRRYASSGIDHFWQADLVDMQSWASQNDGYKYILTVVDVFSKYAWAEPIKDKREAAVKAAFERVFASGRKCFKLQTDQGLEFFSGGMNRFFTEHEITHYAVKSADKASLVERLNRSLKEKMWRYFNHKNTYRWLEYLPELVSGYNAAKHTTTGLAPKDVTQDNEIPLWVKQETKLDDYTPKEVKLDVKIGDSVRVSKVKGPFAKGYLPNWSEEVFTVSQILNTKPIQVKVQDWNGEEIQGSWYLPEIQRVAKPELYRIEKVIETKRVRGKEMYLVKWLGYPNHFNSWVTREQIANADRA
jgi:hypothetical protein